MPPWLRLVPFALVSAVIDGFSIVDGEATPGSGQSTEWCRKLMEWQPRQDKQVPVRPFTIPNEPRRRAANYSFLDRDPRKHEVLQDLSTMGRSPNGSPIFTSNFGLDWWLWVNHFRFLVDHAMTYLDVGANDAVFVSNTFFFDYCVGAHGLCVEPQIALLPRLKVRRSCKIFHGCVSNQVREVEFSLPATGPKGNVRSGVGHIKNMDAKIVKMTCSRLDHVMRQAAVSHHIDWADIDVENHELEAVEGIDWDSTTIDIISIEHLHRARGVNHVSRMAHFLRGHGYHLLHEYLRNRSASALPDGTSRIGKDDVWLREGFDLLGVLNGQFHHETYQP